MAFSAANCNCAAVGPYKLWIYYTTDSLNSATIKSYFTTAKPVGLAAGDFLLLKTYDQCAMLNVTACDASSIQVAGILAPTASSTLV